MCRADTTFAQTMKLLDRRTSKILHCLIQDQVKELIISLQGPFHCQIEIETRQ